MRRLIVRHKRQALLNLVIMASASTQLLPLESEDRKTHFLNGLAGKRGKFKRYGGLPLRYAGGKSLAVGHLAKELPGNVFELVSPFFGGGSFEIACAKELGIEVTGYDVFDILANYWRVQLKSPKKLASRISQWSPDKKTYKCVKERLKEHWAGDNPIKNKTELAAHYWFNHNLSYGPGFLGWMSKIYEEPARVKRLGVVVAGVWKSQRVGSAGSLHEQHEADSVGVEHVRAR